MKPNNKQSKLFPYILIIFLTYLTTYPFCKLSSEPVQVISAKNRSSLSITVYNGGMGFVRETRNVTLSKGEANYEWEETPSTLLPQTVLIQSETNQNWKILSQIFDTNTITQSSLIQNHIGKEVFIVGTNPKTGEEKIIPAKLIAHNDGPIFMIDNQIHIGYPGRIVFPTLPEKLHPKPKLRWEIFSSKSESIPLQLTYQSTGLSWSCDYTLLLNEKENLGNLQSWITIGNSTGVTFENTEIQFIAGKVPLISSQPIVPMYSVRSNLAMEKSFQAPDIAEENLSEYYLYTFDRKITLENNQTKQFSFLSAKAIPLEKGYIFENLPIQSGESKYFQNAIIEYRIKNSKSSNLGKPIPAGTIRILKSDSKGRIQILGEDRIDHTPENESIRIRSGKAFDIVAELRQTNYQKFKVTEGYKTSYEVNIRNRKKEPVPVRVYIPVYGEWKITENNYKFEKESQYKVYFALDIPADKNVILKYSIENKI